MPAKIFYFQTTTATAPEWMGRMYDENEGTFTPANCAFGWTPGIAGADLVFVGRIGATGTVTSGGSPAGTVIGTRNYPFAGTSAVNAGDSFRSSSLYTGKFDAGNWVFTIPFRCTTTNGSGNFKFRLWAGTDGTGVSARDIGGGIRSCSSITLSTTTTTYLSSLTISLPEIILVNEYLFLQCEWYSGGGGAGRDVLFRRAEQAIQTPNFTVGDFSFQQTNAIVMA